VVITGHQVRSYVALVTNEERPQDPVPTYEIRTAGHLAPRWSAWFDGLTVTTEADGTTVLRGPVIDQAALHGLLQKLRDVGIPLVSLSQLPSTPPPEQPAHPIQQET
jgi:hypothetical protein